MIGMRYTVTIDSGAFTDGTNIFAGIVGSTYQFDIADTTAPTIVAKTPTHLASAQDSHTDIVITFSEPVQAGTGSVDFTPSGGNGATTARQINVQDTQVTFVGTVMRINPASWVYPTLPGLVDNGGRTQTITFASGAIEDLAGNSATPLTGTIYQFTLTDTTSPEVKKSGPVANAIWDVSPGKGSVGNAKDGNIVITFTEAVQASTGDVVLTPSGGSGSNIVKTIDITDSSQISFNDAVMTINPTTHLLDMGNKNYTVTMAQGVVKDSVNLPFAGLFNDDYTFQVIDSSYSILVSTIPTQGAVAQSKSTTIVLTFDENMALGTGNIVLTPSLGNSVNTLVNIDVSTSAVNASLTDITIGPLNDLVDSGNKRYTVSMSAGVLTDSQGISYPGMGGSTYQFDLSDTSPPVVDTLSPASGATNALKTANILIYFNEYIQAPFGEVTVTPSGGNGVNEPMAFDVTGSEVDITNQLLTINPTNDWVSHGNKNYTVTINSGVIKDVSGKNVFAGLSGYEYWFNVADASAPIITSKTPAHSSTGGSKSANIVLQFGEEVVAGTGNIVLTPYGGSGTNVAVNIDVSSAQVTFTNTNHGTMVTINPTNDLPDGGGKTIGVTMAADVILDIVGNGFPGLALNVYEFDILDTSEVTIQANGFSPLQAAVGVNAGMAITMTFDENVVAGTGNVIITPSGGNGDNLMVIIDVSDTGQATFIGNVMMVNPTADLDDAGGKTHTVTMAAGVIKDTSGNNYPGLTGTTYQFTVTDASNPTLTRTVPDNLAPMLLKTVNIMLTFSENVQAGTGSITFSPVGGTGANIPVSIPVIDSQVSFSGPLVTVNPTNDWIDTGGKAYTVTMPVTVIKDGSNNQFAGLTGTTYRFIVADFSSTSLTAFNPVQGDMAVANTADIVLTFSANPQAGTGGVSITPSGGNSANSPVNVLIADVVIAGAQATANPPNPLDDRGGKIYTVTYNANVFLQANGDTFPQLASPAYQFLVPDTTAPTLDSYSPLQGSTGAANSADIVLTFNEYMKPGTGNIVLTPTGGQGTNTPVTIDVNSGLISIVDNLVTVNPNADLHDTGVKTYTMTMSTGVLQDVTGNNFAGLSGTDYQFGVADSTAPIIDTYSPAHEATGEAKTVNIVLTFNENVQAGTGNVVITPSGGNGADTPVTISVADNSQITFATNVMTINPTADLVDMGAKRHTVTFVSGVVKDTENVAYGGISGSTYHFNVADSTPPTLASTVPAHNFGGSNVGLYVTSSTTVAFTFDENIKRGTGNIVINPSGGNDPNPPSTFDILSAQVSISGDTVTLSPASPLLDAGSKMMIVVMGIGVITDMEGNAFGQGNGDGFALSALSYHFGITDTTAPTFTSSVPAHQSIGFSNTGNIVITFSENVQAGTGDIILTPSGGNQADTPVTIGVGTAAVTFTPYAAASGGNPEAYSHMTIDPVATLVDTGAKTYTVTMASGVVKDVVTGGTSIDFVGISGTDYQFGVTDSTAPTITTYSPGLAATGIARTSSIVLTFDESVKAGDGTITLMPSGGNGVDTAVVIHSSSGEVSISGTQVTINPSELLMDRGGKTYTVTMETETISDLEGNLFLGLTGTTYQFDVTDSTPPAVTVFSPAENQLLVPPASDVVLTFTETVTAGTGNIVLTPVTGVALTIPVGDAQVTIANEVRLAQIDDRCSDLDP